MSDQDKVYNLLNDFSTKHFQGLAEATISIEDFETLMRKIGDVLSREDF
jgi:hypothetical protein